MKTKVLPKSFFNRDTHVVAQELLGKFLVRKVGSEKIADMIVEIEVYDGVKDRANHGSRGLTPRTVPMFGHAGYWYVYFTYGMHFMINIVTREKGYPAAILLRGVSETSGPGRLTKKFQIDKKLNALPATQKAGLWIEDRGIIVSPRKIKRTPRIGIDGAGEVWAKKKWRYVLRD